MQALTIHYARLSKAMIMSKYGKQMYVYTLLVDVMLRLRRKMGCPKDENMYLQHCDV